MLNIIHEVNTEASLVSLDSDDLNSKNMLFDSKFKSTLEELSVPEKKSKRTKNINISSSSNNAILKNNLGPSLYHMTNKNKRKKEVYKSTNNFFETKNKREIQVGLKSIKIDDDILKKKEELNNLKRAERSSSRSINKKKNKSITNHIHKINDEDNRENSPSNKMENLKNEQNEEKEETFYGEKILIKNDDLNILFSKYDETNNIKDYKITELSEESVFENNKRLSCIINNSPFICSNIYMKNKICDTSVECLLGKDKARFFEKNKNIYKGKSAKELFKQLSDDIFQEIDFNLNDKLYQLDPTKTSIGQLYKTNDNYNNEFLRNRYARDIINLDGNAFLKAFIFNYLEQLIVKKDIKTLTEIMGKMIVFLKAKKQREIISKILAVFKIIINYLEKDYISNAYKILIKSFSEDYIFENTLISFIRESLSESITSHQSYFLIDYLKEIIPEKYIKTNEKDDLYFDYELYIKEIITVNNNELQYELLTYYFLPSIFEFDLTIYTNNDTKTNKILFKHTNIEYDPNNIINIELFIKFGKISIIYSDKFYKENEEIIPLISKNEIPLDKIKIKENESKINCYMCHKIPQELILIDKNFQLICKNCLEEVVKKIIEKRYLLFSEAYNNYFHEEYYCNKIKYEINKDKINSYELNISINDIRHILKNNFDISDEIHSKIVKSYKCGRCQENFTKNLYAFSMEKCGHLICINCLKEYIFKVTDEKVILNYYEYKFNQIKFFCPVCDKEIILSKNFINNLYKDDIYINKAEERLIDIAKQICCFCHIKDVNKVKKKFVIVNDFVSSNSSIDNYLLIHSICNDCLKNLKQNDLNDSFKTFFCDFCGENHQYNKIKFNMQRKRKVCCTHM